MRRTLMKSKIHRATVTEADLAYVGSISIDPDLMKAADFVPNERVEIYNCTTGARLATYAIPGTRAKGQIGINGAAAHLATTGDVIIICSYGEFEADELEGFEPTLVFVDENNEIIEPYGDPEPVVREERPIDLISTEAALVLA